MGTRSAELQPAHSFEISSQSQGTAISFAVDSGTIGAVLDSRILSRFLGSILQFASQGESDEGIPGGFEVRPAFASAVSVGFSRAEGDAMLVFHIGAVKLAVEIEAAVAREMCNSLSRMWNEASAKQTH